MTSHINITLRIEEKDTDVRIPTQIEVKTLLKELDNIFGIKNARQIKIMPKGLLLDRDARLSDSPVASGDILEIMENNA